MIFRILCEFISKLACATRILVLEKKLDEKTLIAFRATGVKNGHSGTYNYGSSGLDPGKLLS